MILFGDERDWFIGPKLGLFVHWGLYAVNGWHEQEQMRRGISRVAYQKLISQFNPRQFNPEIWLDFAESIGMEYICFTTKHHDGFCMWDTALTDFKVTNSPYGRDILKQLADACHQRNFPLCLYYSVVDWNHSSYPNNNASHELVAPEPGDKPDAKRYLKYLKEQLCELCTNYGKIHGIWWDMNHLDLEDSSIHQMIRKLQPAAVINNRGFGEGDFTTPERDWDNSVDALRAFEKPTEACNSVGSESWGYRRDEDYFTSEYLIREIDNILAKGGNYLLNVGPDIDGVFPTKARKILYDIGRWMEIAKESFVWSKPVSSLTENRQVLLTRREKDLYVHLVKRPITDGVCLKPLAKGPTSATLLNNGKKIEFQVSHIPNTFKERVPQLHLQNLPIEKFSNEVMIIKLTDIFNNKKSNRMNEKILIAGQV